MASGERDCEAISWHFRAVQAEAAQQQQHYHKNVTNRAVFLVFMSSLICLLRCMLGSVAACAAEPIQFVKSVFC